MEIRNITAIERFARKHRDAAKWLSNWVTTAGSAEWRSIVDVRKQFPSADGVKVRTGMIVTVFNVRGNEYRLLTHADYPAQRVTVLMVLTHEQYDRDAWKG